MEKIKITNPNKIVFPKSKITKLEVVNYYIEIANEMLPYVENRLLSVIRCHEGIKGSCFYKKHPTTDKNMVNIKKVDGEEYFYINSTQQLIFQAQMGTIEFHVGGSKVDKINKPNIMVFDLDPDEKLSLLKLRDAVLKLKETLDELGLKSFLKTSGGKGYHVVIPFSETKNWKIFHNFSEKIAVLLENKHPEIFTTNIRKVERKNKIFIDFLRNSKSSTCVAPFSLRARENATISMPIRWEDLNKIDPNEITIKNYKDYLSNAWDEFFKVKQTLF